MAIQEGDIPDKRTPQDIAKYYQEQIELAKKDHQNFYEDGKKVSQRYKSGRDAMRARTKRLNILYSNTEVLRAALYGKSAVPDVRRRFGVEDKTAGTVASVLEKSLVYCAEAYDSDKQIELGLLDYLLCGRGVVRIEYEPTISKDPQSGQEFITNQKVRECFVHWKDFLHMPARTWDDILKHGWISFAHRMTRQELLDNFGPDIGARVPLNWMPDIADKKDAPDSLKKAEVREIWDVNDHKRYWIVDGFDEPCRVDADPYGLEQFFPLPEPPAYYATTDSIIPEPEFHVYQDQADDLDEIVGRISRLTKALKRRGVYDQSIKELSRLANAGDNQFIAVDNYASLATKGGLQAAFQTEDISIIAGVLVQLYQQRDMLVQAIWELIGIADIMRGQSRASETLGAQQLKAQFGSQRLQRRQRSVQRWVRDLLKLKSEIIAEHFEPAVLEQITGEELTPKPPPQLPSMQPGMDPQQMQAQYQAAMQQWQQNEAQKKQIIQILRTDELRGYRVDVETDSTVFEDAEAEKQTRSALIGAVSQFITAWGPIVGQSPPLAPVAFELLKFGLGAFKSTRAIEDAIEQAAGEMEKEAAQRAAQGPQPNPEVMKVQQEGELEKARITSHQQIEQSKQVQENQAKQAELAAQRQADADKQANEDRKLAAESSHRERELKVNTALKMAEIRAKEKADRMNAALKARQIKAQAAAKRASDGP